MTRFCLLELLFSPLLQVLDNASLDRTALMNPAPPLECTDVLSTECEPLSFFSFICKSSVPITLNAGRIVGLDVMNRFRFFRKLENNFSFSSNWVERFTLKSTAETDNLGPIDFFVTGAEIFGNLFRGFANDFKISGHSIDQQIVVLEILKSLA